MNETLAAWNAAGEAGARNAMLACCGSKRWADAMVALRPIANVFALSEEADRVWSTMQEADWLEAFACHPRIGGRHVSIHASEQSSVWSQAEQAQTGSASDSVLDEIAAGNQRYEDLFGFTYIVCATGKSAEEMLAILKRRLKSTRETELREAAEQQRQIMQIRLGKWLIE
ncbi:MAG: 2-oxo-4-hydroxy-4-carboxy-5-ureidoimidazoline decarboxylase [Terracidiphilus sp.]